MILQCYSADVPTNANVSCVVTDSEWIREQMERDRKAEEYRNRKGPNHVPFYRELFKKRK